MFRLIATVRGGAMNSPITAATYPTVEDARTAAKKLMHENARVTRVTVVRDEMPMQFVEWLDK